MESHVLVLDVQILRQLDALQCIKRHGGVHSCLVESDNIADGAQFMYLGVGHSVLQLLEARVQEFEFLGEIPQLVGFQLKRGGYGSNTFGGICRWGVRLMGTQEATIRRIFTWFLCK